MKLMARCFTVVAGVVTALALACDPQQPTGPAPDLSLHKNHDRGNPDCRLNGRGDGTRPLRLPLRHRNSRQPADELTEDLDRTVERDLLPLRRVQQRRGRVRCRNSHLHRDASAGMAGNVTTGGGTATTNGAGPNASCRHRPAATIDSAAIIIAASPTGCCSSPTATPPCTWWTWRTWRSSSPSASPTFRLRRRDRDHALLRPLERDRIRSRP